MFVDLWRDEYRLISLKKTKGSATFHYTPATGSDISWQPDMGAQMQSRYLTGLAATVACHIMLALPVTAQVSSTTCAVHTASKLPPGLYAAVNGQPVPVPRSGDSAKRFAMSRPVPYGPSLQLFFVTDGTLSARSPARVLVVRTRTSAQSVRLATRIHLMRKPITNSCGSFVGLGVRNTFVRLNDYLGYYAQENPTDLNDLKHRFHFQSDDREMSNACFWTDDPRVVKGRNKIYIFPGVEKYQVAAESVEGTAQARDAATRYSGVSTELLYLSGEELKCFELNAPLPTYEPPIYRSWDTPSWAAQEAQTWTPTKTRVEILDLKARVIGDYTIKWGH
jgi:hypothetical protein